MKRLTVALVAVVAALGMTAGCANRNPRNPSSGPSTETGTAIMDEARPVLEDGRHPAYITTVDVSGSTVTFDLIRFLTGDEAKTEWLKQHPGETEGPPNDYMIINANPKLRTLTVVQGVTIQVVDLDAPGSALLPIDFAELPDHLTEAAGAFPFWLTVASGKVTNIEEQFLP